jgi:hypothetical protein
VVQHFALWYLTNLTQINCKLSLIFGDIIIDFVKPLGSKYCSMLESENGIEILKYLIEKTDTEENVRHYAQLTLQQYNTFKECGQLRGLEMNND